MTSPDAIEWRTPALIGQLVGRKEAQEILGTTNTTFWRWLKPGTGPHGPTGTYMLEPAMIDAGPVWFRCDVERFAQVRPRLSPGPRRKVLAA